MKESIETPAGTVRPGDRIRIDNMKYQTTPSAAFPDGIDHSAKEYAGREGEVTWIDDTGQLHGSWGSLAVIPGVDRFTVIRTFEKAIAEDGKIVHYDPYSRRTDTFEVVETFPAGYVVWNIGRHNFPYPGYVPLARPTDQPYHIRLESLCAIKVRDEQTALRILEAAGQGEVNEDRFIRLSA